MVFKNYILTTLRLMSAKWWLSLIKVFSLTSGITSFLLVWFFFMDFQCFLGDESPGISSCSLDNILLLGTILLGTSLIYFLVMKSQVSLRNKELFFRKYYGETQSGIILILMIETLVFILISFGLSLILIDQVAPFFNEITSKNVNLREMGSTSDFIMIACFLSVLGFVVGIMPSLWYARNRAVNILKKL